MDALAADANDALPGALTAREGQIIDLWHVKYSVESRVIVNRNRCFNEGGQSDFFFSF